MENSKEFPIEDVLTVTTGIMISKRLSTSVVRDVFRHVTQCDDLQWFQIPEADDAVGEAIRKQLPEGARDLNEEAMQALLDQFMDTHGGGALDALIDHLATLYGSTVTLSQAEGYVHDDPMSVWIEKTIKFV